MIESFGDGETKKVYQGIRSTRLPEDIQHRARRKLRMLNQARELRDLRIAPANRLEAMRGNLRGHWSIRINDQWRILFRWKEGTVGEARIKDYH